MVYVICTLSAVLCIPENYTMVQRGSEELNFPKLMRNCCMIIVSFGLHWFGRVVPFQTHVPQSRIKVHEDL